MYKNILVPIALGHKDHVTASMDIAHKLLTEDGQITALHVVEAIPGYAALQMPDNFRENRQSDAMDALKSELAGFKGVKAAVVVGHSGRTIQSFAEQHGTNCIIMASHQPGIQDYFLGSTAAWVVRHAKCSVHVLR